MNVDFVDIKSYIENKEQNIFIKAFIYSLIIGVLLIFVVVFSSYKKKNLYYKNVLYIENEQITLTIPMNELELIMNNNKMIIYNKIYLYKIEDIVLVNDESCYYKVKISFNSNSNNFLYSNAVFEYKILLKEESILRYIVRVIKGV